MRGRISFFASAMVVAGLLGCSAGLATSLGQGTLAPASAELLKTPAKQLFGHQKTPAPMKPQAVGFYSKGCLAGGVKLADDGAAWQAMRPSRNRQWGHPSLVRLVEKLAVDVQSKDHWPGLLVGDLAQPRGGPMLTGHASHQIGLDADIWLTPMPDRTLSRQERESMSAVSMLATKTSVDPNVFTPAHVRLIRRAATYSEVERILVHPAIKKALCDAAGSDRAWLGKVRPYWGHHYHMHIRMSCPADSPTCRAQAPPTGDDGCGKEIDDWFKLLNRPPRPITRSIVPKKPAPPLTLAGLPDQCRTVIEAGIETGTETARPVPPLPASAKVD